MACKVGRIALGLLDSAFYPALALSKIHFEKGTNLQAWSGIEDDYSTGPYCFP